MERIASLREEARKLRDIASRSTEYPDIHRHLLTLARQCEELADTFGDTLEKAGVKKRPGAT